MSDALNCDICDQLITLASEHVTYNQVGIRETLNLHSRCLDLLLRCKGNIELLPDGRLKRAYLLNKDPGTVIKTFFDIYLRPAHRRHILLGLQMNHEEGLLRIHNLAVDFFGLPEPDIDEYYSINQESQLILMRKRNQ